MELHENAILRWIFLLTFYYHEQSSKGKSAFTRQYGNLCSVVRILHKTKIVFFKHFLQCSMKLICYWYCSVHELSKINPKAHTNPSTDYSVIKSVCVCVCVFHSFLQTSILQSYASFVTTRVSYYIMLLGLYIHEIIVTRNYVAADSEYLTHFLTILLAVTTTM